MGLRVLYNFLLATRCVGVFETAEPPLGVDCSTSLTAYQKVKRPYRIGGHPMVIWMWCLFPYGRPRWRAAQGRCLIVQVSNRSYIYCCVLASRLLYWIPLILVWGFQYYLAFEFPG